jgi:ABC-type transport system involved in multi-copper enzyme maturation permease subunit
MTTLTTLAVPVRSEEDANLRPLPWRRITWVTWRQHRTALTGMAVLSVAIAVCVWLAGLHLHHAYVAAIACHPASSFACSNLINAFNGTYTLLAKGIPLQVVPALIGAFVGAPVLAREIESGSFRFTWTQGFGRGRWTLGKLVTLGVAVTAVTGAMAVLFSWYYQPYFPAGNRALYTGNGIATSSLFAPGLFDLRGVTFAAWTLVAFAIGVLAGVLIRRVVPAIVTTLVAYTGLAVVTGGFLRQRYLAPLITSKLNIPYSSWVISQQWVTKSGLPASQHVLNQVLLGAPPSFGGKGGVPQSLSAWQYLAQHGFTQLTTYQPADRFWPFQWIEGGWLFALSLLLMGVAVWLVHRRAI